MKKTVKSGNSYLDIHEAARKGKDDVMTGLLNAGTDINSRQSEGLTPLMIAACFSDKRTTLETLLKRGADINLHDHGKRTALMHCINCNRKEECKILIKKGANIDAQDKHGMSALMKACYLGNIEIVKVLLKNNAVTKYREKRSGNTAILIALANRCIKKSFIIVQLLLDHGADPSVKNKEGTSGLYYSALMGHTAALALFLQFGKKSLVNQLRNDSDENESALHQASTKDNIVMVTLLLHYGSDINLRTGNHIGNTPLMCAAYKGHIAMVKFLLDRGAEIHKGDNCGCTAVMHAASVCQVETVQLLLERGALIENSDGMSALMFAIITKLSSSNQNIKDTEEEELSRSRGLGKKSSKTSSDNNDDQVSEFSKARTIQLLIEKGANLNLPCMYGGEVPLIYAASKGMTEIATLLVEGGADPRLKNKNGASCADICPDKPLKQYLRKAIERKNAGKPMVPSSSSLHLSSNNALSNYKANGNVQREIVNTSQGQEVSTVFTSLSAAIENFSIQPSLSKQLCVYCHQYAPNYKKCGACATATPVSAEICYCSAECQKLHWPVHKLTCLKKRSTTKALRSPSPVGGGPSPVLTLPSAPYRSPSPVLTLPPAPSQCDLEEIN
mmetsp:Transcript_21822/g.21110  ORF Transcript_21822/g.21110 Transcript_21822/m.21110 type:complete len:617 (-) Transcript_21822:546-2396(-)|eukprot:CAMPEP_0119051910 /NCGR_PEP_ID=MMETSP1177-20130426/73370_1 /TAXON_ID=2985 /ORGANISM="Ochromonas sp, Strain CCMP1899" /LENGTH=616 /DNA_ID=CAMNT_0007031281 /DNA_START=57 /DNA_END=1907 /DNA_ORIENTATION=+